MKIDLPSPANKLAASVFPNMHRFEGFMNSHVEPVLMMRAIADEINGLDDTRVSDKASVVRAAINTCVLGLVPGASLGHSHFVPFKGKVSLIVGYKGYIELAIRSGQLAIVHTPQVVLKGEQFRQWSDEQGNHFMHEIPAIERDITKPNIIGAYVAYTTVTNQHGFTWVPRSDIDQIKQQNVWLSHFASMCLTVPVRRAAKFWRRTSELSRALRLADENEMDSEQSCPEAVGVPEYENDATLLRRSLDANWARLECNTKEDKDAVLQMLLASRHDHGESVTYETVCNSEELLNEAMNSLHQLSHVTPWGGILGQARQFCGIEHPTQDSNQP